MQTPLINIQDLQELVGLSVNVSESVINPHIISAQNWQLCEIIGLDCLEALQDRFCTNQLTTEDQALMTEVKPFLVYHTYSKYIIASSFLSTATGLVNVTGDNTNQGLSDEKKTLIQMYQNNAEAYTQKIVKILVDNPTQYPCYTPDENRTEPKTYFI